MKTKEDHSIPRFFVISIVALGLLLSAFSIASGNNPLLKRDTAVYKQNLQNSTVTVDQLANWMVEGKRDFILAGFREKDECTAQKKITPLFNCHDIQNLKDREWIRKTYRSIDMPIIVYGSQTADGLEAAAQLVYLGYNVRLLEGGFNHFADQILNPDLKDIDVADADSQELEKLAVLYFFTGDDPILKEKGQKRLMARADGSTEEEAEEVELGEAEEEGC